MASRRAFLRGSAAAGAALLLGGRPGRAGAELPLERTTVRLNLSPSLCAAPQFKSSPQKLIADGTDWRFLKELKRELKG